MGTRVVLFLPLSHSLPVCWSLHFCGMTSGSKKHNRTISLFMQSAQQDPWTKQVPDGCVRSRVIKSIISTLCKWIPLNTKNSELFFCAGPSSCKHWISTFPWIVYSCSALPKAPLRNNLHQTSRKSAICSTKRSEMRCTFWMVHSRFCAFQDRRPPKHKCCSSQSRPSNKLQRRKHKSPRGPKSL